jgi:hypothetical protein
MLEPQTSRFEIMDLSFEKYAAHSAKECCSIITFNLVSTFNISIVVSPCGDYGLADRASGPSGGNMGYYSSSRN